LFHFIPEPVRCASREFDAAKQIHDDVVFHFAFRQYRLSTNERNVAQVEFRTALGDQDWRAGK
jgi:hypothetical protein